MTKFDLRVTRVNGLSLSYRSCVVSWGGLIFNVFRTHGVGIRVYLDLKLHRGYMPTPTQTTVSWKKKESFSTVTAMEYLWFSFVETLTFVMSDLWGLKFISEILSHTHSQSVFVCKVQELVSTRGKQSVGTQMWQDWPVLGYGDRERWHGKYYGINSDYGKPTPTCFFSKEKTIGLENYMQTSKKQLTKYSLTWGVFF